MPRLERTAKKHPPPIGTFGTEPIELMKHIADHREWKRSVFVMEKVIECRVNMTMSEHDNDDVAGCKSFVRGNRDFSQQFRGYRRRDTARFFEELLATELGRLQITSRISSSVLRARETSAADSARAIRRSAAARMEGLAFSAFCRAFSRRSSGMAPV